MSVHDHGLFSRVGRPPRRILPVLTEDGKQEVTVLVERGFRPDLITARAGVPLRLKFFRNEAAACSEWVIIEGVGIERHLPEGKITEVEFTPTRPAELLFTCRMGMYVGRIVIR